MAEYFSTSPQEEKVFDYKPDIKYIPRDLNTRDNTGSLPTDQSLNAATISGLTTRYVTHNVADLIKAVNKKEQLVSSLSGDMKQFLLDSKYSIVAPRLPTFTQGIVKNGIISFDDYQSIPKTSEYKIFHDMWFKESVSIRGNLVAEMIPFISDIEDDISRMKRIIEGTLLFETKFSLDSNEADIKRYIMERAESYENNFGLIREAQSKRNMIKVKELFSSNQMLESFFKIDSELNILVKNSLEMLDSPIEVIGRSVYKEIDGKFSNEAIDEIGGFTKEFSTTEKDIRVPLFFGFKSVSNAVIKGRLAETTQYSVEIKDQIEKKLLLLGKTWKNTCIPDIANYLSLGYNSSKMLYHLTNGIVEINNQLIEALKDFYKTNLGEMNNRTKIEKDIVYKNMARHIYRNLTGGL